MKASFILVVSVFLKLSHICLCQRGEAPKPSTWKKKSETIKWEISDDVQSFDDIACSAGSQPHVLTNFSGWFTSPNFPANYPNFANCQWLIRSQSAVVRLDFEFFVTEESFDAVKIYDGETTSTPVITSFDGPFNSPPTGIRSSGPSMLVVFTSDDTQVRSGFNVSYTSAPLDFTPDPCYSLTRPLVTTNYNGTFQSNGFPDSYWNHANCQWLFDSQEPGGTVEVKFDHFSTEPDYDIVWVYDGSSAASPVLLTLFGSYAPGSISSIRSSQRYLFVRFLSDNIASNYPGFNGSYTSVPAPLTTTDPPMTTEPPETTAYPETAETTTSSTTTTTTTATTTTTTTTTTTSSVPAGSCGSILNQSPSDAVVAPNFNLMCHLNKNDTQHLDERCYDLLQNIPGYGDADSLISQGGNFGCSYSTRDDFVGSDNACFDEYQWESRLRNCITCTKLFVCIRFS